jgi:hypothetical protein
LLDGLFEHPAWHFQIATVFHSPVWFHPGILQNYSLHPGCFDHLHIFSGEGELFDLKILFHMLWIRRAGQWEHPNLHGKSKDNLCQASP